MFFIYISEAHAADVWNIGMSAGTINYEHKSIQDRIRYINKMKNEHNFNVPIYADNMDNEFESVFASWPFRYFVTIGHRLDKIGEPNDSSFDLCELFEYVNRLQVDKVN